MQPKADADDVDKTRGSQQPPLVIYGDFNQT